jgi:cyanate permease
MKTLDYVVLAVFVVGLIVLCFFQSCSMDIYFLVLGFGIAAMSLISMIFPNHKDEENDINQQ